MKNSALLFFSLLFVLTSAEVSLANRIESKLTGATVFLKGAQIQRQANINIPSGISEVIISDLPVNIDPNSIQVTGIGSFMILSVSFRRDYLSDPQTDKSIKIMQDSLKYYKQHMDYLKAMLTVYKEEESLLLANKNLGGKEKGFQISELKAAADFMRERLTQIKKLHLQTSEELEKTSERYERIRAQLSRQQSLHRKTIGEIAVMVSAQSNTRGELSISYIFPGAGWEPVYDLRSGSIEDHFDLSLKANVYQSSGENWDNVQLILSTGTPARGGQIQRLTPWRLSFLPEIVIKGRPATAPRQAMMEDAYILGEIEAAPMAESPAEYVRIAETQTTIQYQINTPVNISGDNNRRMIDIQNYKVPAKYEYYVVPKLDTDAFLIAKVTGWEDYIALPGTANLFFEGTFVGKSEIDPYISKDTLELSLGRDKGVSIKREKKKEYTSRTLLGSRQIENIGWEIEVRNNKRQNITLNIIDQVPLSTHKDIDVRIDKTGGAIHNEATGILTWRMVLNPSESRKVEFGYNVRYPKDKRLILE